MNRLWVRFSLVILGVLVLLLLIPTFFRDIAGWLNLLPEGELAAEFAELRAVIPPEQFRAMIERVRLEVSAAILIILTTGGILALIAGIWLSRTLTAPLSRLETAAEAIAGGDLSQRVLPKGSDEMIAVATAFNTMAAQLEKEESLRRNLLADVAHELRNPLHVLQGNLQAILDDVYPLNKGEIAHIYERTTHLTTLVNDLHDLAQAEAHQLSLNRQETELATLVKETTAVYQPIAAARGIELRVELLGALPRLAVDPGRMRQALDNLLHNALRHTADKGHIRLQVEQNVTKKEVIIRVEDDGAGMTSESLPYVFDRFYRSDSARSRDEGGAGLGLAITKAIIEAHEGEITAASDGVGKGSRFTIVLPLHRS
jgi:signal transduction histidine kinase